MYPCSFSGQVGRKVRQRRFLLSSASCHANGTDHFEEASVMQLCKHKFFSFSELIHKRQLARRGWACHQFITTTSDVLPAAPTIAVPKQRLTYRDVFVSMGSCIMRLRGFSAQASRVFVVECHDKASRESKLRLHCTAECRQTPKPWLCRRPLFLVGGQALKTKF